MKKVEDIMDYYTPETEPLTAEEEARILQRALDKAGLAPVVGKRRRDGWKTRRRMVVLIAACIAVLAFGAVGFAATALDVDLQSLFKPGNDQQTAALSELAVALDAEAEDNGLVVRAKQAVGDSNSVYILFDLIAPEGMALSEAQYTFLREFVQIEGVHEMGWHFEEPEDANPRDNQKSFILCLTSSKSLSGRTLEIEFTDFSRYKTEEEMAARPAAGQSSFMGTAGDENDITVTLIPGQWELKVPLNYQDASSHYKVNQQVKTERGTVKVKKISISPISATLVLDNSSYLDGSHPALPEITIHMRDGTLAEVSGANGSTSQGFLGTKAVLIVQFHEIVDPAEIEAVCLDGVKLDF